MNFHKNWFCRKDSFKQNFLIFQISLILKALCLLSRILKVLFFCEIVFSLIYENPQQPQRLSLRNPKVAKFVCSVDLGISESKSKLSCIPTINTLFYIHVPVCLSDKSYQEYNSFVITPFFFYG